MTERIPDRLVRVEYEIPPLRAIYSTYYEDRPQCDDAHYIRALAESHPQAKFRKLEHGIKPQEDGACA